MIELDIWAILWPVFKQIWEMMGMDQKAISIGVFLLSWLLTVTILNSLKPAYKQGAIISEVLHLLWGAFVFLLPFFAVGWWLSQEYPLMAEAVSFVASKFSWQERLVAWWEIYLVAVFWVALQRFLIHKISILLQQVVIEIPMIGSIIIVFVLVAENLMFFASGLSLPITMIVLAKDRGVLVPLAQEFPTIQPEGVALAPGVWEAIEEGVGRARVNGVSCNPYLMLSLKEYETGRNVLATAYEICSVPEVRVSLAGDIENPETLYSVYIEYRKRYLDIVERIPEGETLPEIFVRDDGKIGLIAPTTDNNRRIVSSLGFVITQESDGSEYLNTTKEALLKRMLGILVSPTLHEWREDDKVNRNPNNDRVRTLFFVPRNIEIDFRDRPSGGAIMYFSKPQRQHFIQNYLQWYIEAKYLSGDISSFNTVVASWLSDQPDLRMDAEHQKEDIRKKLDGIWDDFTDALGVAYKIERFKRFELLRRLLLATNIEELVPLITSDVTQVAILSSAILRGTLEAAQEAKIFRNIQKVTSTLGQQFEGSLTMAYLSGEKLERIKEGLKKLGFQDTDEGLQMFRNIWRNLFYLRGERGSNQTLRISTEGLSISNPSRTMYPSKVVPSKNKKGETVENVVREYEGGRDKLVVSWAQIRQIGEVDYDYTFLVDFSVKLLTSLASIGGKDKRPEVIDVLEEEGPANIVVRLPGREQPLFEIFAVKRPKEVWKLITGMAELMADEEGPATLKDLLSVLEKD